VINLSATEVPGVISSANTIGIRRISPILLVLGMIER